MFRVAYAVDRFSARHGQDIEPKYTTCAITLSTHVDVIFFFFKILKNSKKKRGESVCLADMIWESSHVVLVPLKQSYIAI